MTVDALDMTFSNSKVTHKPGFPAFIVIGPYVKGRVVDICRSVHHQCATVQECKYLHYGKAL